MPEDRSPSPYLRESAAPAGFDFSSGGAPGPSPLAGLDHRWAFRAIYKSRWIVALCAFAGLLYGLQGNRDAPYEATTTIRLDPPASQILNLPDFASLQGGGKRYFDTEVEVLKSPTLAARVVRRLGLAKDPEFFVEEKPGWLDRVRGALASLVRFEDREDVPGAATPETDVEAAAGAASGAESSAHAGARLRTDAGTWRVVSRYLNGLKVRPKGNSALVEIQYRHASPELAAEISRTHADEFLQLSLESRTDATERAREFLQERLSALQEQVEGAEQRLNEFRREHRQLALSGGEKENVVLERLATLNSAFASAKAERITLEADAALVQARRYDHLPSSLRDPSSDALLDRLDELRGEYAELSRIYKPGYSKMADLQGRIETIEKRLAEKVAAARKSIEGRYLAAKQREEALAAEVEEQRRSLLDLNDLTVEYQLLQREAQATRSLYDEVLARVKQSDVASALEASSASIVDAAQVGAGVLVRRSLKSPLRGVLGGLLLGIALAFARAYLDNTVKTPDDVRRAFGLPSLAVVPSFATVASGGYGTYGARHSRRARALLARARRRGTSGAGGAPPRLLGGKDGAEGAPAASSRSEAPGGIPASAPASEPTSGAERPAAPRRERGSGGAPIELVAADERGSVVTEAYRTLRTAILLSRADDPPRVIQISSSRSAEGKTVTTTNTAVALAQSGARVLVIDADLRRPRCHRILHQKLAPGLVDLLTGQAAFDECVRALTRDHLGGGLHGVPGNGIPEAEEIGSGYGPELTTGAIHLMPAGSRAPNPAEILGSRRMRHMLARVRELYDYVLIDSPPLLPVADSVLLAAVADGVVLVIKGQKTPEPVVAEAVDKLLAARAKLLGAVLNDVDVRSADYYYYRGYYSSYAYESGVDERLLEEERPAC